MFRFYAVTFVVNNIDIYFYMYKNLMKEKKSNLPKLIKTLTH